MDYNFICAFIVIIIIIIIIIIIMSIRQFQHTISIHTDRKFLSVTEI